MVRKHEMNRLAIRVAAVCGLALLASAAASAQKTLGAFEDDPKMPDTPLGRVAQRVISAMNSGDAAEARTLVEECYGGTFRTGMPLEAHVEVLRQFHLGGGGFDFIAVRRYPDRKSPDELILVLKARRTGLYRGLMLTGDGGNPPRLTALMLQAARPPKGEEHAPIASDAELAAALKRVVEQMAARDEFHGAVLLARGDEVLYAAALGTANRRTNAPNEVYTRFGIASMGKMFTAVAIAQLVEQGRLSYDDLASKHLGDDWLNPAAADSVRISHLLQHTSGLGDFLGEMLAQPEAVFDGLNDYRAIVRKQAPSFTPGAQWQYSNAGYLLLGAIIEKVTGRVYDEHVRETVLKPAGMTHTEWATPAATASGYALPYVREDGAGGATNWVESRVGQRRRGTSAGGAYSTVGDFHRFIRAVANGKLVRADTRRLLWSNSPVARNYGYGFDLVSSATDRVVGHAGVFPGVNGQLDYYEESGYTVAVLSNMPNAAAHAAEQSRLLILARSQGSAALLAAESGGAKSEKSPPR